jgi:acetyltransferase-like isoleucine patch superfamily enzyme
MDEWGLTSGVEDIGAVSQYLAFGLVRLAQTRGAWDVTYRSRSRVRRWLRRILLGREPLSRAELLQQQVAAGQVTFGPFSYGAPFVDVYEGETNRVQVGSFCSIARDVEIFVGGNHRSDWVTTFPFRWFFAMEGANHDGHPTSRGDVQIGNDVWLGVGATIMSGVTIGDGAVVAARAVVTRDVRPYAIVAGSPAREVRRRFPDDHVEALLAIRWWDWPLERVLASVEELCSSDLTAFLERHGSASGSHPGT